MLLFSTCIILCFYVGTRQPEVVLTLQYTKLIQPPPSARLRTPRWWLNNRLHFQGTSGTKTITPPMDSGGPGDASLQSARSSEAGKPSNSPNAASRDGCISVALQPPVCSFGRSVGLDVFLAGGGWILRSKEDRRTMRTTRTRGKDDDG